MFARAVLTFMPHRGESLEVCVNKFRSLAVEAHTQGEPLAAVTYKYDQAPG